MTRSLSHSTTKARQSSSAESMRQVVVLAGGLGTRAGSLTRDGQLPKALVDVAGRPFIDRKLDELAEFGATEVLLLTGHGSDALSEHFARHAPVLPVVLIADGPQLLGTGGAVRAAIDSLSDQFWLTYGDTFLQVPAAAAEHAFDSAAVGGLMTVLHNRDRWQLSNTTVNGGFVVGYDKTSAVGRHEWIDYGMLLLRRDTFREFPPETYADLSEVIVSLVSRHQLVAYEVTERFHDIGTPEAHRETSAMFKRRDLGLD